MQCCCCIATTSFAKTYVQDTPFTVQLHIARIEPVHFSVCFGVLVLVEQGEHTKAAGGEESNVQLEPGGSLQQATNVVVTL